MSKLPKKTGSRSKPYEDVKSRARREFEAGVPSAKELEALNKAALYEAERIAKIETRQARNVEIREHGLLRSVKRPLTLPAKPIPPKLIGYPAGVSGNPATQFKPGEPRGPQRNKYRPITDAMREFLAAPYIGKCKRWRDRQYTNAQALAAKQLELALDQGDMRAAEELANRVEGKTVSVTQLQGPNGGPIELSALSAEEKQDRIRELMSKAGGEL